MKDIQQHNEPEIEVIETPSVVLYKMVKQGYIMGECIDFNSHGRGRVIKALDAALEVFKSFPQDIELDFKAKYKANEFAIAANHVQCTVEDIVIRLERLKKYAETPTTNFIEFNGPEFGKFAIAAYVMTFYDNGGDREMLPQEILKQSQQPDGYKNGSTLPSCHR